MEKTSVHPHSVYKRTPGSMQMVVFGWRSQIEGEDTGKCPRLIKGRQGVRVQ